MWLKDICKLLTVAGASHAQVLEAIENVQFKDFEDCLQDECAKEISADFIVTRNIEDFRSSKVKAITPQDLLVLVREDK